MRVQFESALSRPANRIEPHSTRWRANAALVRRGGGKEPRDIVGFANALTRNAETAIAFCDRVDRQRNYRLTRTKTKAEIAAIRSNSNTGGDINLVVRVAGDRVAVRADEAPGGDLPLSE